MIRSIFFLLLSLTHVTIAYAQERFNISNYYSNSTNADGFQNQTPAIQAHSASYIQINWEGVKENLSKASTKSENNRGIEVSIDLPTPDGNSMVFMVYSNTTMHAVLKQKFDGIRTFDIISENDPSIYGKLDFTEYGLHAMIFTPDQGTWFIDPRYLHDDSQHIVYHKSEFITEKDMVCEFEGDSRYKKIKPEEYVRSFGSCELRTYRLALCATAEYTNYHGGSVANAASAQITTMNRVNGVYERDMAITMTLVPDNDELIFTNASSDPFSNGNAFAMLDECHSTCTSIIGTANFDIGHVFGTNSGGVAGLGVVCSNSNKGRGVTGSSNPIGDPFDIDYVAHEMGHQFACNHSFNNSCGGNRNDATAVEPGSGSSIMAYAGICSPNVQSNSDDHFHGINLEEMGNFVTGFGGTCASTTSLSNEAPEIVGTNGNVTIPKGTPFALTANAVDSDGDPLVYCWEQIDHEISSQPPSSTSIQGPNFRSNSPISSPTRYFPDLQDLANGSVSQWEVLSTVEREFEFRVMVRENRSGGGCNDHADVTINTHADSGPFLVTRPNSNGIGWIATSSQNVEWDVANTDAFPVDAAQVDIFLSLDGGNTYPIQLANNTPNDGSEVVVLPNLVSSTCRIMVMAENGTFFNISNFNFEILPLIDDFSLTADQTNQTVCPTDEAVYSLGINQTGSFTDPVTLSVVGLPDGLNAAFESNPVIPGNSIDLTIAGSENVLPGEYEFQVEGSSSTGTKSLSLTYQVIEGSISTTNLLSPENELTGAVTPLVLSWSDMGPGTLYEIELATDSNFTNLVYSDVDLSDTQVLVDDLLDETTYFWRVLSYNVCNTGPWSELFSFTTGSCMLTASSDVPKSISSSGTPTVVSSLTIAEPGIISDVNVIDLTGLHTWISDLTITVTSPEGTSVTLFQFICSDLDNWDLNFDDQAEPGSIPCPPTDGGNYQPLNSLSIFNGENKIGTWTLTVSDGANFDGGSLESWGLQICTVECTEAEIPILEASETTICSGEEVTLSIISGELNDALQWEWYENECGGTVVGTGTSIPLNPDASTTYYVRGVGGCASEVDACASISIDVLSSFNTVENVAICVGDSYTFPDGTSSSESSVNTSTFMMGNGCDSTIVTNLSVIELDSTINGTTSSSVLFSNQQDNATYQWIDCSNGNEPIPGATESSFEVNKGGSYAVIVTSTLNPECQVTSECIDVVVGLDEITQNHYAVFPNPSHGIYTLELTHQNQFESIEVLSLTGRSIYKASLIGKMEDIIDISNEAQGVYILKLINGETASFEQLIKN
jgi:subtilisin-like proprotein convertase family protein